LCEASQRLAATSTGLYASYTMHHAVFAIDLVLRWVDTSVIQLYTTGSTSSIVHDPITVQVM